MSHHVLLLGGHGKIAQFLTPLLLKRSWTVTSLIRTQDQVPVIEALGKNQQGKLNVLVASLEEIKDVAGAKSIIDNVKPDYVVWSAGAGGKGPQERTFLIDRDAASFFIRAAATTPSITRFLLVSHLGSRHRQPAWWSSEAWDAAKQANNSIAKYYAAKLVADEVLVEVSRERGEGFAGIDLRPGRLSDDPAGKVELGKTKDARGKVSRASVAEVAALLLEADGVKSGWLDLLDGDEDAADAVKRVVRDKVDAYDGEGA
ncbi:NAD dependent epimerase/dehydratase [Pleurostoma richardsiae]|uniref:NAD dependent epimerase/dehydratase n=1 Tax=Pleurostoma richardsiae TaxID=41990 RepID=A0AA38RHG3_9PEZI|nr:NAD dependent epimerase/dehydratase [Pleurostoma richardsiae]